MFLSNRPTRLALTCIFALFVISCGAEPTNKSFDVTAIATRGENFPFSTKEPEVFQGNFAIISGDSEKRWFLARKGDRWRFDIFSGNEISLTQLKTDKLYLIDHVRKTYCVLRQKPGMLEPPDPILSGFFRSKKFRKFEDLGIERGLHKYKVRLDEDTKEDIFIMIDMVSSMIVKQEFYEGTGEDARIALTYEVRDLKLNVDDGVLTLPDGYKMVKYDEFQRSRER